MKRPGPSNRLAKINMPHPYTPRGWPTMTLARWWDTVGRPLRAVAPKPDKATVADRQFDWKAFEAILKGKRC